MDITEKLNIKRIVGEERADVEDIVVREMPLTIILNNQELLTLLCSPADSRYLAVGLLASEGLIKNKDEIKKIMVDDEKGMVCIETVSGRKDARESPSERLLTSGGGKGTSLYGAANTGGQKVESQTIISARQVYALIKVFLQCSENFIKTGGVHSAALCDTGSILIFNEDIGRHNAIDKVFGRCLLENISTDGRIMITSGRISSEILLKVARRNIPILITKAAPTNLGVKLADNLGVTLIGFARGQQMNIYSHGYRVMTAGKQEYTD